jgi:hypothetical protein
VGRKSAQRVGDAVTHRLCGRPSFGPVSREILTYRQADSRRRDFTGLARFAARLISVGDAVASFNPIHGQGLSSAALHASCLSDYLVADPPLTRAAREFFDLQAVVTDSAWTLSAGDDAARLDSIQGNEVPEDVARQRRTLQQILQATLVDQSVAEAFAAVSFMLAHRRHWPNRLWSSEPLPPIGAHPPSPRSEITRNGAVTLIGMCGGVVGFGVALLPVSAEFP